MRSGLGVTLSAVRRSWHDDRWRSTCSPPALLAFTIVFYAVVYTMWLKRSTPQNIVIGGLAGALPPVIGWAAATGTVPLNAWLLCAIIFLWTPPHFWALSLYTTGDYAKAGVPMMPVVRGAKSTRLQILVYSLPAGGRLPWRPPSPAWAACSIWRSPAWAAWHVHRPGRDPVPQQGAGDVIRIRPAASMRSSPA